MAEPLLSIENLHTSFYTEAGVARAVDGVSLSIGCGKSVTARSVLRLIRPPGRIEPGSKIVFEGKDILTLDDAPLRAIRGARIAMVFQEPMTALNPVFTVGDQIAEVVRIHGGSKEEAWKKAVEMLGVVGIPSPAERAKDFPHQLSGGMRQRVVIAMALVLNPALIIADEPTTALDVTIQAQILELLRDLQQKFGTSILLITHDLGVVAETASRVIVMYGGEIVEEAAVDTLFGAAHHPYTEGLMRAMPKVGEMRERLSTIPGTVPPPTAWPKGCRFRDRCPYSWDRCESEHPPLYQIGAGHVSRCHLAEEPERRAHPHPALVEMAVTA
jgi:peptide/nickel transport system ATP-binding protein